MNKTAARVTATMTTVSSLSSPNCGFEYPKTRDKVWYKKNDTRDTLNHMSRLKTFILGNKKLKPKTGRFRLIKSRLEIKKAVRYKQIYLFKHFPVGKKPWKIGRFFCLLRLFFACFDFLSFVFPRLVGFLCKGSINDKGILPQCRGVQLCSLEEIIHRP